MCRPQLSPLKHSPGLARVMRAMSGTELPDPDGLYEHMRETGAGLFGTPVEVNRNLQRLAEHVAFISRFGGMPKGNNNERPFQGISFDLPRCLDIVVPGRQGVIDIGGDTMFRTGASSLRKLNEYETQVGMLKAAGGCAVVVLAAPVRVLEARFEGCKPGRQGWFDQALEAWETAQPYWDGLADVTVETEGLAPADVCAEVLTRLRALE